MTDVIAGPNQMQATHLAVRLQPMENESATGYLMRIAMANGLSSIRELHRACSSGAGTSPFNTLQGLLALKDAEARNLFGPLPARWGRLETARKLAVSDFIHSHRRWCPRCLAEQPYQRGHWDLKLVTLCTHHQEWLHDGCPRCGAKQTWTASSLVHCDCGADLSMGLSEPTKPHVVALTAALEGDPTPTVDGLASHASAAPLSHLQWHRLVRMLGQFSGIDLPARPGQISRLDDLQVARTIVENAAQLLHEWPAHFVRLLDDIQKAAGPSISLKRSFGVLYRVLYVELGDSAFQFLRDAFEEHLRMHWWGIVCRRHSRLKASTLAHQARMTTKRASQATGIRPSTLEHLVQLELLPALEVSLPSGRTARAFHQADVIAAAKALEGAVNLTQFARRAGLAERRIRDLVAAGVLTPIVCRTGGSSWLFSATDVERIQIATAEHQSTETPTVAVHTLLKSARFKGAEGASLIAAVLAHELQSFSTAGGVLPVGEVTLRADAVTGWRASWRDQHGTSLSVPEAARELHLKQEVVYHLIKRKLLSAKHDPGGWRLDRTDLDDFRRQYVTLSDLARERHTSPRKLMSTITVQAATGPGVDDGRQYFFRRNDVAELFIQEHLRTNDDRLFYGDRRGMESEPTEHHN